MEYGNGMTFGYLVVLNWESILSSSSRKKLTLLNCESGVIKSRVEAYPFSPFLLFILW